MCRIAVDTGTRVLFATPHAHAEWDSYPRTPERERLFAESFPKVRAAAGQLGLELRRGWEVFPTVLRDTDPDEFMLEGTRAVLIEFPGHWLGFKDDSALTLEAADRIVDAGLVPVVAHPERSIGLRTDFAVAQGARRAGLPALPERRLGARRQRADRGGAALAAARRGTCRVDRLGRASHTTPAAARPGVRSPRRPLRGRGSHSVVGRVCAAVGGRTDQRNNSGVVRVLISGAAAHVLAAPGRG